MELIPSMSGCSADIDGINSTTSKFIYHFEFQITCKENFEGLQACFYFSAIEVSKILNSSFVSGKADIFLTSTTLFTVSDTNLSDHFLEVDF